MNISRISSSSSILYYTNKKDTTLDIGFVKVRTDSIVHLAQA